MDHPLIPHVLRLTGTSPDRVQVLAGREGRLVCRVTVPDGDVVVKIDHEPGAFAREARAMRTLQGLGLPVSDVRRLEDGPPSVLVASWADGRALSLSSHPDALAAAGAALRRVHAQPAGPPFSGHESIADWISGWLRSLLPWWVASGAAPTSASAVVERWLDHASPFLATREGRLILFDGRPEHILVDDRHRIHLIDVADLMPGDPAMDLAVLELEAPGILGPILAGYAPTAAEQRAFTNLVPLYAFLRALSGAEWQGRVGGDPELAQHYLRDAARRLVAEGRRIRAGSGNG